MTTITTMLATVLKWGEAMWILQIHDPNKIFPREIKLGEAGNIRYSDASQVQAVRIGNDVLVSCDMNRDEKDFVIPASTKAQGFHEDIDGNILRDIMEEGVVYSYNLLQKIK